MGHNGGVGGGGEDSSPRHVASLGGASSSQAPREDARFEPGVVLALLAGIIQRRYDGANHQRTGLRPAVAAVAGRPAWRCYAADQ